MIGDGSTVLAGAVAALAWQVTAMPAEVVVPLLFVSLTASSVALFGAVAMSSSRYLTVSPVELLRSRH